MRNQSTIRSLIREMLNEAMKTPFTDAGELPGIRVDVDTTAPGRIVIILSKEGKNEYFGERAQSVAATLEARKIRPSRPGGPSAPCKSVQRPDLTGTPWQIKWANSKPARGWGPFLYHVMLEIIEEIDPASAGLMADREEVSNRALSVWEKFNAGVDPSIEFEQMDDVYDTLTPGIEQDNCVQDSVGYVHRVNKGEDAPQPEPESDARKQWLEASPITKVYRRKSGAVKWLDRLRAMGIYYVNEPPTGGWDD